MVPALPLYALTLLLGSFLLFLVQPLFARMALPLLGGTPAVWNTCMVFFQAALLAGYGYAHGSIRWLGVRRQSRLHLLLLAAPLLLLPLGIPEGWAPPRDRDPTGWLLALLTVAVGLPFFAVSTQAPLLQRWFGATGHEAGRDPYFLYAASNLGSMAALLAYPFVIEPLWSLSTQSTLWSVGYGALVLLTGACALSVGDGEDQDHADAAPEPLPWSRRGRWVALSFVPSSLMLGVTTHFTSDIAATPLLWVGPLALYLASFIVVFARRPPIPHWLVLAAMPTLLLGLVLLIGIGARSPLVLVAPLHLGVFFLACLAAHGELALDRPSTSNLTEYFLWMSVGGVLGGLFNAVLAPLVFIDTTEYPIALVLAAMLLPQRAGEEQKTLAGDLGMAAAVGAVAVVLGLLPRFAELPEGPLARLIVAVPVFLCMPLVGRPVRFGLGIACVLAAATLNPIWRGDLLYADRSFFGVHRVVWLESSQLVLLMHGSTMHGVQHTDASGAPAQPLRALSYYASEGPMGEVHEVYGARFQSSGVVGLGSGALAAYYGAGQRLTYYEIDPAVVWIAEESGHFSYLSAAQARGARLEVVLGDARHTLAEGDQPHDLLILDAFSSNSIPVHLLTREAFEQAYLPRVAADGLLVLHISNRYLDIAPVVGRVAGSLGLHAWHRTSDETDRGVWADGVESAHVVVLARDPSHVAELVSRPGWEPLPSDRGPLWTDARSDLLGVMRW